MNKESIESFLLRMEAEFEELDAGMWVLRTDQGLRIVAHLSPPVLLLRSAVLPVPDEEGEAARLFRRLLELNASDLVSGAYGLDDDEVILTDALDLETLDFDRFQAAVESMQMALASHHEALAPFRPERAAAQTEGESR